MAFNTDLIQVLLVLFVLPISLGIGLLSWILGKFSSKKLARSVRTVLFVLLGLGFFTIVIWDHVKNRHVMKFDLGPTYEVMVNMQEIDSFLDWPIDVEVIILNKENGKKMEQEFLSEGPCFQFLIGKEGHIWMKGYGYSQGINQVFDFKLKRISSFSPDNEDDFVIKKEITLGFEVLEK